MKIKTRRNFLILKFKVWTAKFTPESAGGTACSSRFLVRSLGESWRVLVLEGIGGVLESIHESWSLLESPGESWKVLENFEKSWSLHRMLTCIRRERFHVCLQRKCEWNIRVYLPTESNKLVNQVRLGAFYGFVTAGVRCWMLARICSSQRY